MSSPNDITSIKVYYEYSVITFFWFDLSLELNVMRKPFKPLIRLQIMTRALILSLGGGLPHSRDTLGL